MTEQPEEHPPDGTEEPGTVDVGEPDREAHDRGAQREAAKPDLDEREGRIRTQRKAAGPPLEEPEAPQEEASERALEEERDERPVDPA